MFGAVFLGYLAGAALSAEVFGASTASAFFPPAGLTVAAMLLTRRSVWPAIVVAIALAEFIIDVRHGVPMPMIAGYALADVIEPLVGASVVRAWQPGIPDLTRVRDMTVYVLGACVSGPLAGALIGGSVTSRFNGVPWSTAVFQWFAGDAVPVLVMGTSILLWRKQSRLLLKRSTETAVIMLATLVLSIAGFRSGLPPAILVLPPLAWAAVRLDLLGTALAGVVVAAVGNVVTGSHHGLISGMSVSDPAKAAVTQLFVAVLMIVALLIAQEVSRRARAVQEHEVERTRRLHMESLSELAQELVVAVTPRAVGEVLARHLGDGIGATALNLGEFTRHGSRIEWIATAGHPPMISPDTSAGLPLTEPGVVTEAALTGQPVLIGSLDDYPPRLGPVPGWMTGGDLKSVAGLPLFSDDAAIGVLLLGWPAPQQFGADQLARVTALATMVGQALARAKTYADDQASASVLHSAVHPDGPIDTVGLDYCFYYQPADTVHGLGGDWYDVLQLPDNRTYFAVGDIMGHGLTAVKDMAQLRSAARAFAYQGRSPAQLLADLNGYTAHVCRGEFATAMVAIFDRTTGSLTYASAGHPPAFLRRSNGDVEVVELSDANGPLLGPIPDALYSEVSRSVEPGDILVMYTDGLVENGGQPLDTGITQARDLISRWSPTALLNCGSLAEELAPPPRTDDTCLLTVRFKGRTRAQP